MRDTIVPISRTLPLRSSFTLTVIAPVAGQLCTAGQLGGGEPNVSVSRALLGTERNRKREWMPVSLGTPKSESLCSSFSRYNPLYVRWASWPDRQRTRNSLVAEGLVITKLHGNGSCEKIFGRAVSIKNKRCYTLEFFHFPWNIPFPISRNRVPKSRRPRL